MTPTYQHLLEAYLLIRNAPYRSDPERQESMATVTEYTLITILEKLAAAENPTLTERG